MTLLSAEHSWIQNAKKAPNVSLGETVKARLKQFSVMNKLKKRALRVIAEHLSVEEVAGIKEAFEMMDSKKTGKINLEELKFGLHKLGQQQIPDTDLQILMEAADVDGDGTLNYGEFVAVSVHLKKMANDEHLHKAFSFFDQNQSDYIEIEELREALNDEVDTNSEEVVAAIMQDVDTDKVTTKYEIRNRHFSLQMRLHSIMLCDDNMGTQMIQCSSIRLGYVCLNLSPRKAICGNMIGVHQVHMPYQHFNA
jgi:Ca2+-binding EF-hand superfamily protein